MRPADERFRRSLTAEGRATLPRLISHDLYFSGSEGAAVVASKELARRGFTVRLLEESKRAGDWHVLASRVQPVTRRAMRTVWRQMDALAHRHGGRYFGWNAPEPRALGRLT